MSLQTSVWFVVVLAMCAANLPFVSDRYFGFFPHAGKKGLGWRLIELAMLYFLVGGIALAVEHSVGQIYPQKWEFYATTVALFITLAFPGFVFRYLARTS